MLDEATSAVDTVTEIIDSGTHSELMEKKGYYYELQRRQYDELAWEV